MCRVLCVCLSIEFKETLLALASILTLALQTARSHAPLTHLTRHQTVHSTLHTQITIKTNVLQARRRGRLAGHARAHCGREPLLIRHRRHLRASESLARLHCGLETLFIRHRRHLRAGERLLRHLDRWRLGRPRPGGDVLIRRR